MVEHYISKITVTNHQPKCGVNPAIWRRMIMIPFNCLFVNTAVTPITLPNQRPRNDNFKNVIAKNENFISAFFNWLLIGAERYYNNSVLVPIPS